MMNDQYENLADSLVDPARAAFMITPSDQNDLPEITRAIFVGTGGDLVVQMLDGDLIVMRGAFFVQNL